MTVEFVNQLIDHARNEALQRGLKDFSLVLLLNDYTYLQLKEEVIMNGSIGEQADLDRWEGAMYRGCTIVKTNIAGTKVLIDLY